MLLGRASECEVLDELVAAVLRGESRSLVIEGEAGIGKTELLAHLTTRGSPATVLRAAGVESEMELPFATLHQLCASTLDDLGNLPAPQAQALEIVFGERAGAAPDRFLVGLAVLGLFSELAGERPLVCVVDDAQWVDQASALILAFVARRLRAEPIGIVFAARQISTEFRHLPRLRVTGLRSADAQALLEAQFPSPLDEPVRERILAEMRGNPLALIELPRGLHATGLAGGFGMPPADGLPGRIEQDYIRRLGELPEEARRLLILASAEPVGDPMLLQRAREKLSIDAVAIDGTGGLLEVHERVTFRHPLVRSAAYRSASAAERRAAHLALGEATDRALDPDRRAWHLAAATPGPDEAVAAELERSALRAQGRGGLAAAAAFLRRSLALTADPKLRGDRALAAAQASLGAGSFEEARGLLTSADVLQLDDLQRARLDLLKAELAYSESRGADAPALLLRAARVLSPLDPRLSRETYLDAWSSALFAGSLAGDVGMAEVSREARLALGDDGMGAASGPGTSSRPADVLLDGFSLAFTESRQAAVPVLSRAGTAFVGEEVSVEEVLRWGWLATAAAVMAWDFETCLAVSERGVRFAREAGALTVLAVSANVLAQALALAGDFDGVAMRVAEADAVVEATGTQVAPYGALVLAGLRGREEDAAPLIEGTVREATAGAQGTAVQYAHWADALLQNGLGRYGQALAAARLASEDTPELFVSVWASVELVEAAARHDRPEIAGEALARIEGATVTASGDWAAGLLARSRALLSEGDEADALHREAIACLSRTRLRPDQARAHLLYGEWLRRAGRRVDARAQLRVAHDQFAGIGMEAFAERARSELQATGENVRRRTAETSDDLTPQELQIARLARDGLSNPEIGERLFLSPRTVEWHLRKVFAKLEIRSRRELARVLPVSDSQLVAS